MQLTYRWTKSLDPSLRKGVWTPEEDAVGAGDPGRTTSWEMHLDSLSGRRAPGITLFERSRGRGGGDGCRGYRSSPFLQKLLQAVAKYGEQDWFKIREEVPGRSDAQCRDR